jgi:hypothetical protein
MILDGIGIAATDWPALAASTEPAPIVMAP